MSPISGQQSHSDQIADKNFTSEKKSREVTLLSEIYNFAHFGKIMDMNLTSEKKSKKVVIFNLDFAHSSKIANENLTSEEKK